MVSRVVTISRLRQTYLRFRKVSIGTSFFESRIEFLASNTVETTGFWLQKTTTLVKRERVIVSFS